MTVRSSAVSAAGRLAAVAIAGIGALPVAACAVSCSVTTLPANFGIYDPQAAAAVATTGAVNVACTCGGIDCVSFTYRIDIASGQSGSTAARQMRSDAGRLQYNLYVDAAMTTVWGTGSAGYSALYLAALFGARQTTTVYAGMPAGQFVGAGSYADTPTVTVSF